MSLWKRIKNLWWLSGLDQSVLHKESTPIQDLQAALFGGKQATVVDMSPDVDLGDQEENV